MNFLLLAGEGTIYVAKWAIALRTLGHKTHTICTRVCNPDLESLYNPVETGETKMWEELVFSAPDPDICICFGEPGGIASLVRKQRPNWKIVYCATNFICDDDSIHGESARAADYILAPSEGFLYRLELACEQDGNPATKGGVAYPAVPEKIREAIHKNPMVGPKRLGFVYEGGFACSPIWRDYREVVQKASGFGIPFTLYSADYMHGSKYLDFQEYMRCGAIVRQPIDYIEMLRQLRYYQCGWACGGNSAFATGACVTHKFFEYDAAGIPVVTDAKSELGKLTMFLGNGYAVDRTDALHYRDIITACQNVKPGKAPSMEQTVTNALREIGVL